MDKFQNIKSIPAYLPIVNVDTDMIIPKQFLKTIKRTGLGVSLFFEMRYDKQTHEPIKDFVLNVDPYTSSKILIGENNFGCGNLNCAWKFFMVGIGEDTFRNNPSYGYDVYSRRGRIVLGIENPYAPIHSGGSIARRFTTVTPVLGK